MRFESARYASSNLLYDVAAEMLKSPEYTNSLTDVPVKVIDPAKTATYLKGAIVSLDAQTGQVVNVDTHEATIVQAHVIKLCDGFLDVWDAKRRRRSLRGTTR